MKLLLTLLVVAGVWYFFFRGNRRIPKKEGTLSRLGRALEAAKDAMADSARARKGPDEPKPEPRSQPQPPAVQTPVELKPCPRCGTYIAVGTTCTCTKA